ncbi:putative wall-associated receptor kinase-like 16 [Fagus crenata]
MALRGMLFHQQLLLGLIILAATAASQDSQPNSSCIYCGSLCIPYPFGTRWGQYLDESFHINCDNTSGTPKPTLSYGGVEVLNISLDGELRVSSAITRRCDNNYSILMSAKLQNPASILIPAKTLLGVSIARVRRGSKAMA